MRRSACPEKVSRGLMWYEVANRLMLSYLHLSLWRVCGTVCGLPPSRRPESLASIFSGASAAY